MYRSVCIYFLRRLDGVTYFESQTCELMDKLNGRKMHTHTHTRARARAHAHIFFFFLENVFWSKLPHTNCIASTNIMKHGHMFLIRLVCTAVLLMQFPCWFIFFFLLLLLLLPYISRSGRYMNVPMFRNFKTNLLLAFPTFVHP